MKQYILFLLLFIFYSCSNTKQKTYCLHIKSIAFEKNIHGTEIHGNYFLLNTNDYSLNQNIETSDSVIIKGLGKKTFSYSKKDDMGFSIFKKENNTVELISNGLFYWKTNQEKDSIISYAKQNIEVILVVEGKKYSFKPCK